ncbi:hypothetical protein HF870_01180 [Lactobacillus johnsonii]|uniref:hypothetical protein n=1 Tax=Lactobacillus johnsonii TaxID=33959 RepID=UPI001473A408|nr:hypothetical protein [Lactobacillus johnsonii]NME19811.1 hypothetical protein [Lactobacillus johnsonii]
MTEKRADYRKKQQKEKVSKIFDNFKRLKRDRHQTDASDQKVEVQDSSKFESREDLENRALKEKLEDKVDRLKKRLNYAILIVVVLLVIVLFALFKL